MPERAPIRTTPKILADLRTLRVMVFHPDDDDGKRVLAQLGRIGCTAERQWPPAPELPDAVDLIFLAVRPEILNRPIAWLERTGRPPLIAIVTYESPIILEFLLRVDAESAVSTPVRSFGLLAAMTVGYHQHAGKRDSRKRVAQLEKRLLSVRTLNEAKALLIETQGMTEEQAYQHIRTLSMVQRQSVHDIAEQIIQAHSLLSRKP